jgi:hypothetical protein
MKRAAPVLALLLLALWVREFLLAAAARRRILTVTEQPRSQGSFAQL